MATVTKENIGPLHEKLSVKLEKADYLPSFEKILKDYSRKANIPGFRKGQVPAGLIKKMYGTSLFTDEVLKTVDRELVSYLDTGKLDIFAQPLPLEMELKTLDVNNPSDYTFHFEIGMKPDFKLPDLAKIKTTRYKVEVTEDMIDSEIERLRNRHGNMKDLEKVEGEENVLNVVFTEVDESGNEIEGGIRKDNSLLVKYFKEEFRSRLSGKTINDFIIAKLDEAFDTKELEWIVNDLGLEKNDATAIQKSFKIAITKIGLLEKKELNEEFFNLLYPPKIQAETAGEVPGTGTESVVKTEADLRNKIKEEIALYWEKQANNQIHDQVYHELVEHTDIKFPEAFLKKWVKTQSDPADKTRAPKTDEEVEKEFPAFLNQLKWTLVSDKIVQDTAIQVQPDEIKNFAKQQLFSYMGGGNNLSGDQSWVNDYIEKMMKDRKYVEDAYTRLQTQKIFEWLETQVKPVNKEIGAEEFRKMIEEHQHHHH